MGIGEAAFRALADATADCVFLADRRGRYLAVNRGLRAGWAGRRKTASAAPLPIFGPRFSRKATRPATGWP